MRFHELKIKLIFDSTVANNAQTEHSLFIMWPTISFTAIILFSTSIVECKSDSSRLVNLRLFVAVTYINFFSQVKMLASWVKHF